MYTGVVVYCHAYHIQQAIVAIIEKDLNIATDHTSGRNPKNEPKFSEFRSRYVKKVIISLLVIYITVYVTFPKSNIHNMQLMSSK